MADLTVRRGGGAGSLQRGREWDPFQRMQELMNWDPFDVVGGLLSQRGQATFLPAFEVKETKDAYVFKADLPGVEEKDLDITLTGDRLSVSGKREAEKSEENDRFYAFERSYGTFSRSFTLPEGVDGDQVRAEMKNGVLTLTLPKRPETQPKRIQIGAGSKSKA